MGQISGLRNDDLAGLWFRRGRLARVFSSLAASCRHCSENPLIPAVQISADASGDQKTIMIDATYLKAHRTTSSLRVKKGGLMTNVGV